MKTKACSNCVAIVLSLFATTLVSEANPYNTVATFTVTSTGSSPSVPGTLTWAVYQANYFGADVNYVRFDIPSVVGQAEIVLSESLYIARLMILDGTSQPGYSGSPLIRINASGLDSAILLVGGVPGVPPYSDGSPATSGGNPGVHGVSGATVGSTIQGFHIFNYAQNAITVFKESEGSFLQYNWMGFLANPNGTFTHNSTLHPDCRGIGLQSSFTTVRFNTISGVSNGITLGEDPLGAWSGRHYYTNAFENNNIGTDPTGSFVIGNDEDGIVLGGGASENFIGPGNVLSGMASAGVELLHPSNYGNIIIANMIGVNREGTAALGNGQLGVLICNGADFNDVGGPSGGNVISANTLGGIAIGTSEFPVSCTRIYVESNLIGTDVTGLRILGQQNSGITCQNGSEAILHRNVIGGQLHNGIVLSDVGYFINGRGTGIYGNWIGKAASASPVPFNTGPGRPGVQLLNSASTTDGPLLPNGGFGVYAVNSRGNNIQIPIGTENPATLYLRNIFGSNLLGEAGFEACTAAENGYFP